MPRVPVRLASATAVLLLTTAAAVRRASSGAPATTREVIAVYFGTQGTDSLSGMIDSVRKVRAALQQQAATTGRALVMRGVSLEPSVENGIRHLARSGIFDEVSLGGNWTNSEVVRYLGGDMTDRNRAAIPQVVLLEREVGKNPPGEMSIGPEREIARYAGTREIDAWLGHGAPLPR